MTGVTVAEAFVKAIRDQGMTANPVHGQDAIILPLLGPRFDSSHDKPVRPGLRIEVDLTVAYHAYCKDKDVVAACLALRSGTDIFAELLDGFGVDWCHENEHLQVQGIRNVNMAGRYAWRLGECAVAVQMAAQAAVGWLPK